MKNLDVIIGHNLGFMLNINNVAAKATIKANISQGSATRPRVYNVTWIALREYKWWLSNDYSDVWLKLRLFAP